MDHSVTTWVGRLRDGDSDAACQLWDRYFVRLVDFARGKLRGTARQAADEEDVALSAFHSLCRAADRFPRLNDRQDLWQVLVVLAARKAFQERRRQQTSKRGGRDGEAGRLTAAAAEDRDIDELVGSEASPELAAVIAEQHERLMAALPDDTLRQVARMRLEGHTAGEIATSLACSERTAERKLTLIRSYWEQTDPG